jgi:hypothetical protein
MKRRIVVFIACVFVLVALFSLTGCQQCVKAHDVPYTYYTSHCMSYHSNGTCAVSVPLLNHGYQSHCDEWEDTK